MPLVVVWYFPHVDVVQLGGRGSSRAVLNMSGVSARNLLYFMPCHRGLGSRHVAGVYSRPIPAAEKTDTSILHRTHTGRIYRWGSTPRRVWQVLTLFMGVLWTGRHIYLHRYR